MPSNSRAGSRAVLVKFLVGFSPFRAVRLSSSLGSVSFYAVLVRFSFGCAPCRAVQLSSSLSSVEFHKGVRARCLRSPNSWTVSVFSKPHLRGVAELSNPRPKGWTSPSPPSGRGQALAGQRCRLLRHRDRAGRRREVARAQHAAACPATLAKRARVAASTT